MLSVVALENARKEAVRLTQREPVPKGSSSARPPPLSRDLVETPRETHDNLTAHLAQLVGAFEHKIETSTSATLQESLARIRSLDNEHESRKVASNPETDRVPVLDTETPARSLPHDAEAPSLDSMHLREIHEMVISIHTRVVDLNVRVADALARPPRDDAPGPSRVFDPRSNRFVASDSNEGRLLRAMRHDEEDEGPVYLSRRSEPPPRRSPPAQSSYGRGRGRGRTHPRYPDARERLGQNYD